MAEVSSSQESLPLSQETLANIWSGIPAFIQGLFFNNSSQIPTENCPGVPNLEQLGASVRDIQVPFIERKPEQCSVPHIGNFPGIFNFAVSFPSQENVGKTSKFVYSTLNEKLYVMRDFFCPFNFSTSQPLNGNYEIRAMLYFSTSENASEVVERCVKHKMDDSDAGDPFYEHFIRCTSQASKYIKRAVTIRCNQCSVTVPYEDPPIGQNYSTYLYKFKCFTSCYGGPNRRPVCIVFTLEDNGLIIGRCKVDLKVCACPFRDIKADEKMLLKKNSNDCSVLADLPPAKRKCKKAGEPKTFVVTAPDEECYNLLCMVKKFYEINKRVKANDWAPTVQNILQQVLTSSDEDKEV